MTSGKVYKLPWQNAEAEGSDDGNIASGIRVVSLIWPIMQTFSEVGYETSNTRAQTKLGVKR